MHILTGNSKPRHARAAIANPRTARLGVSIKRRETNNRDGLLVSREKKRGRGIGTASDAQQARCVSIGHAGKQACCRLVIPRPWSSASTCRPSPQWWCRRWPATCAGGGQRVLSSAGWQRAAAPTLLLLRFRAPFRYCRGGGGWVSLAVIRFRCRRAR